MTEIDWLRFRELHGLNDDADCHYCGNPLRNSDEPTERDGLWFCAEFCRRQHGEVA